MIVLSAWCGNQLFTWYLTAKSHQPRGLRRARKVDKENQQYNTFTVTQYITFTKPIYDIGFTKKYDSLLILVTQLFITT